MIVMMIVRTAPDAAGADGQDAEDSHQALRQFRFRQDRVVLLVMINDEKPQQQKSRQHATGDAGERVKIPERAGRCAQQKKKC